MNGIEVNWIMYSSFKSNGSVKQKRDLRNKQKYRVTLALLWKQISNVTNFSMYRIILKWWRKELLRLFSVKTSCLKYLFVLVLRHYIVVIFNNVTSRNYSLLTYAGSLSLIVRSGRTEEFERCFCKIREMTTVNPKSRKIAVGVVTNQEAVLWEMIIGLTLTIKLRNVSANSLNRIASNCS